MLLGEEGGGGGCRKHQERNGIRGKERTRSFSFATDDHAYTLILSIQMLFLLAKDQLATSYPKAHP